MLTVKPGYLVSIKTYVRGGVSYDREELDKKQQSTGQEVVQWKTTKITEDPNEHEQASRLQGKISNMLLRHCIRTPFGPICPENKNKLFLKAQQMAEAMTNQFNSQAKYTHVSVHVIRGRIADNDAEATRAIAREIRILSQEMKRGIDAADPQTIRDAASKAKALGQMVDEQLQEKVSKGIKAARKAARQLVARVEKKGEEAQQVIAEQNTGPIDQLQAAFLDLEEEEATIAVENQLPAINIKQAGELDMDD